MAEIDNQLLEKSPSLPFHTSPDSAVTSRNPLSCPLSLPLSLSLSIINPDQFIWSKQHPFLYSPIHPIQSFNLKMAKKLATGSDELSNARLDIALEEALDGWEVRNPWATAQR